MGSVKVHVVYVRSSCFIVAVMKERERKNINIQLLKTGVIICVMLRAVIADLEQS